MRNVLNNDNNNNEILLRKKNEFTVAPTHEIQSHGKSSSTVEILVANTLHYMRSHKHKQTDSTTYIFMNHNDWCMWSIDKSDTLRK